MIDETVQLTRCGNIIYEGSFSTNGVFVRADILVKNGNSWDIYEVKATASTKTVHKPDVAIQWYVIGQHLPLKRAFLVHLNTSYVRRIELNIQGLFTIDDITEDVHAAQASIESTLSNFKLVLSGDEPKIAIGRHCDSPYECDFHAYCWGEG